MTEGPLKTGRLGTAQFLKNMGVREGTLPALDMARITTPTVGLGDYGGLVVPPKEWQRVVVQAQQTGSTVDFYGCLVINVKGAGTWLHSMFCDQNTWVWRVVRPHSPQVQGLAANAAVSYAGNQTANRGGNMGGVNDYFVGEVFNTVMFPSPSMRNNLQYRFEGNGMFFQPGTQIIFARQGDFQIASWMVELTEIPD